MSLDDRVFYTEMFLPLALAQRTADLDEISGQSNGDPLLQRVDQPGRARQRMTQSAHGVLLRGGVQ